MNQVYKVFGVKRGDKVGPLPITKRRAGVSEGYVDESLIGTKSIPVYIEVPGFRQGPGCHDKRHRARAPVRT